jgi:hypothetical protein
MAQAGVCDVDRGEVYSVCRGELGRLTILVHSLLGSTQGN